jgi:hypothetical protein
MRAVSPTDQPEEDLDEAEKDPLIGTHTLRKTGYLFAVWSTLTFNGALSGSSIVRPPADIHYQQIMTSARHTSINNANLYIKDASTYHALVKREQKSARHAVGYWESIVVELRTKNRRLTTSSHYYKKPIWALAEYYILHKYQLPEDCTIGTMLHCALSVHDCTDILDKTYQMAADKFTPNEYSTYRSMLDQAINWVYVAAQIYAVESLQNDPEIRNAILRILQARGQPLGAGAKRLRIADAETEDDIMIPDVAEDPVQDGTGTGAGTGPVIPDFVPNIPVQVAILAGAEVSVTVATVPTVPTT